MSISTAAILAAGMGVRLRQQLDTPKGFIYLGGLPIVEESVLRLIKAGMQRIFVVAGYQAQFYRRLCAKYQGLIEVINNPNFASSGTMSSLYCLRGHLKKDFLLLESDLIYEFRALTTCLNSEYANLVLLSGRTGSGDEVLVRDKNGKLAAMSKDPRCIGPDVTGEFVGISKISVALYQSMLDEGARLITKNPYAHYDMDCMVSVAQYEPIYCIKVERLLWSEIDNEIQLSRARDVIYPAIVRGDRQ